MTFRILVAAMMAAMALSGCIDDDATDTTPTTDSDAGFIGGTGFNGTGTAVGGKYVTGFAGTEPTLGIDSEGVVYMTAFRPTGTICDVTRCPVVDPDNPVPPIHPENIDPEMSANAGAPIAIASFDQGQTWVDLGPDIVDGTRFHRETLDPYLYLDPTTDRVILHDLIAGYGGFMSWTDDQGGSWFSHVPPAGNPQANDHQTIVAAAPRVLDVTSDYPNILYMCVNNVAYASCTTSLDGGLTWTPQNVVQGSQQSTNAAEILCSGQTGHLKASPDGIVYLPSVECPTGNRGFTGFPSEPVVYITADNGLSWIKSVISTDMLAAPGEHETSIAVDEEGNVYALWIGSDYLPYLAHSVDGGFAWSEPRMVAPSHVTATTLPALAAGSEGRVAFSYAGTTAEGGNSNPNATRTDATPEDPNGLTWNTYMGITVDALADDLTVETVTTNDPATDPMVRGNCGLTRCPGTFDFHDLWIDDEGRPWASWVDACEGECNTNDTVANNADMGFVGTLRSGPSLRGDGMLEVLPVQAVVPGQDDE